MRPALRVANKVLVVAPNWIGDALMALPLLAELKAQSPDCHITLLGPPAVAGLLARSPLVDRTIAAPWPHGGLQLLSRLAMARRLRRENFDTALVLPNSLKSALVPALAGIRRRLGYLGEARRVLLTSWLPNAGRGISMVKRYLALLEPLGLPPAPAETVRATLSVSTNEVNRGAEPFSNRSCSTRGGVLPRCRIWSRQALAGTSLRQTG